ncbi:MAG: NAD-dependent epimerase/dehydratase family protein [Gammaproteobacteria bacterium]|nr:NAD-dependent epimerase/dehydratase family protein [Gammaproteobacteria bacterium]
MRIFVTGASGFVGGAAAARLAADGHDVRAMSRTEAADRTIENLGAAPVRCDLQTVSAEHVGDAEAVLHCAAYVADWGPPDAWYQANVLGTQRMLDAAAGAGARRFIHMGTEAAIVRGQHILGADETEPLALDSPYPYCATKAEAERRVLAANGPEFATIVLRPRFIWGPGDQTILPALEQMAGSGQFRWLDGGRARTSTTHIDNLVAAIVLALDRGTPGQAYFILDDGERTMREVLSGLAASRGITLPDRALPAWLAGAIAAAGESVWRTLRLSGAPPLTRHAVMVMSRDCTLDDSKARRDLGYQPVVSFEEGLRQMSA